MLESDSNLCSYGLVKLFLDILVDLVIAGVKLC